MHKAVKSLAQPRVGDYAGTRRPLATLCSCVLCGMLVAACAGAPRKQAPVAPYTDAVPPGFPDTVRLVGEPTRREFERQSAPLLLHMQKAANGNPIDFLALSGGGVADAFSGTAALGLLRSHWLGALFGASVFQGEPLRELVDRFVTDELLRAVAVEAEKGRLLLVATTNLDRQQVVIWNMGVIAAHGGEEARKLFRDVLVASASVPGVFPPVLIRVDASGNTFDEMHVDGSTTATLLV